MAEPKIRYTGDGAFHQDIPARSLSAEEYDALPTDLRALVRASPLYDYAGYAEKVKAAREPAAPPKADAPKDTPPAKADDKTTG